MKNRILVLLSMAFAIALFYQIGQNRLAIKQMREVDDELKSTVSALERSEKRAANAEKELLALKSVPNREAVIGHNKLVAPPPGSFAEPFALPAPPPAGPVNGTIFAAPGGHIYDRARIEARRKEQELARIDSMESQYALLYPQLGIVSEEQKRNFMILVVDYTQSETAAVRAALSKTLQDPNNPGQPAPDAASPAVQARKEAAVQAARDGAHRDFVSNVQERFGPAAAKIIDDLRR